MHQRHGDFLRFPLQNHSPRNPTFSQHGPTRYFFQNEAKATPKNASFHLTGSGNAAGIRVID